MIFYVPDFQRGMEKSTALFDMSGKGMTYNDLKTLANVLRPVLKRRTVVLVLCEYSMETVAFYYAMMNLEIVPILVDARANSRYIKKLCEAYRPKYLWGERKELFEEITQGHIVWKCNSHIVYETQWEIYDLYSELALVLATSGSTGSPKTVRRSYRNLEHNASMMRNWIMHMDQSTRGITSLPMHHCFGLSMLHIFWCRGASICLYQGSVLHTEFYECIRKFQISTLFAVPYSLELIAQAGGKERDFSSVSYIIVGGGSLTVSQKEFLLELCDKNQIIPYYGYGQTEGTCSLTQKMKELSWERGFANPYQGEECPVGRIDDIKIKFGHVKSQDGLRERWNMMSRQINWDRIIFVLAEYAGRKNIPIEIIERFHKLKKKRLFINMNSGFGCDGINGIYIPKNYFSASESAIENYFDVIGWMNRIGS